MLPVPSGKHKAGSSGWADPCQGRWGGRSIMKLRPGGRLQERVTEWGQQSSPWPGCPAGERRQRRAGARSHKTSLTMDLALVHSSSNQAVPWRASSCFPVLQLCLSAENLEYRGTTAVVELSCHRWPCAKLCSLFIQQETFDFTTHLLLDALYYFLLFTPEGCLPAGSSTVVNRWMEHAHCLLELNMLTSTSKRTHISLPFEKHQTGSWNYFVFLATPHLPENQKYTLKRLISRKKKKSNLHLFPLTYVPCYC